MPQFQASSPNVAPPFTRTSAVAPRFSRAQSVCKVPSKIRMLGVRPYFDAAVTDYGGGIRTAVVTAYPDIPRTS